MEKLLRFILVMVAILLATLNAKSQNYNLRTAFTENDLVSIVEGNFDFEYPGHWKFDMPTKCYADGKIYKADYICLLKDDPIYTRINPFVAIYRVSRTEVIIQFREVETAVQLANYIRNNKERCRVTFSYLNPKVIDIKTL